ncbi:MAG: T9SS type A sorting domain-containing protein, partial [Candidatus Marinimicrobia bacterium]|nr:T9SS type A sorting domain-containing protein [Candidatus Neomarinimicrobiota bacterium]
DCAGEWGGATELDYCGVCDGDNSTCSSFPAELSTGEWSAVSVNTYDETCGGTPTSTSGSYNFAEIPCENITISLNDDTEHTFALSCESAVPVEVSGTWVVYGTDNLCLIIDGEEDCTFYTYDDEDGTVEVITGNDEESCYGTVFQLTSTLAIDEFGIPTEFSVYQNYPNPFNPSTTIEFDVATPANVSLVVYDLTGKEVYSLASGYHVPGRYSVVWNANDSNGEQVSSGMYIYQLRTSDAVLTKKLVLLR